MRHGGGKPPPPIFAECPAHSRLEEETMYPIHCLNNISEKGTALLTEDYTVTQNADEASAT